MPIIQLRYFFQFIYFLAQSLIQPMIFRQLRFKFSADIGQQQNNMKKFYREASFSLNPKKAHPLHNYIITLDGKTIKTPYHNILAVPSSSLAFLIANEFNRQVQYLKTGEMPFLAMCRTAVDADIQGHLAEHLKHTIYEYLKTDTLLFNDDKFQKEFESLVMPIINKFSQRFDMKIEPSKNIYPPIVQINENFTKWIDKLNNWELIGVETMTIWLRSSIAAVSIANSSFSPDVIQIATALQEATQMKGSGQVQQKMMDMNQVRLMVAVGESLFNMSTPDVI